MIIWAARPVLDGAIQSLLSETDIELAKTGLESELKLLEGIIRTRPDDRQLLELASQGFTGYTMMFVEDIDRPLAAKLRRHGIHQGIHISSVAHYRPDIIDIQSLVGHFVDIHTGAAFVHHQQHYHDVFLA